MRAYRSGLAILEMLLAMGLGLLILLPLVHAVSAATVMHFRQQQHLVIEEEAYYLLDIIERAIQQAGHVDPLHSIEDDVVAVRGLDNAVISTSTDGISLKTSAGIRGSDVLAVHFSGSSPDGTIVFLNCAGFNVPPSSLDGIDRGWSIFYLVRGVNGTGDFRCKYRGNDQWDSQTLASGIATLQFLYGLDTDNDGLPNQFVNATTINQQENSVGVPPGSVWRQVVAVHIALVMQAEIDLVDRTSVEAIDLFGRVYSDRYATQDPGVRLLLSDFSLNQQKCLSRSFQRIVFLRNRVTRTHQGGQITMRSTQ